MLPLSKFGTLVRVALPRCERALVSSSSVTFANSATLLKEPTAGIAGASRTEPSKGTFELLPGGGVVIPSFDLQRRVGNAVSQFLYQRCFEKEFTEEGFLNGLTQATVLCGQHIADGNWDRLGAILNSDEVDVMRQRHASLSDDDKNRLRFTSDDIICSFLHSAFISGKRIFRVSKRSNFAFYGIAVSYIRRDRSINMDEAPQKLLRSSPPGSIMISNLTISRPLNPLGIWKVTKVNFFDYRP